MEPGQVESKEWFRARSIGQKGGAWNLVNWTERRGVEHGKLDKKEGCGTWSMGHKGGGCGNWSKRLKIGMWNLINWTERRVVQPAQLGRKEGCGT